MVFDWTSMIAPALSAVVGPGGAAGVWTLLSARHKAAEERAKAEAVASAEVEKAKITEPAALLGTMAAFQRALNEQAEQLTADLRQELRVQAQKLDRAERRIEGLEDENQQCRAEAAQLRGDLRDMRQRAESLEAHLRRLGVDMPARSIPGSLVVLEGEHTTVLTPGPAAE